MDEKIKEDNECCDYLEDLKEMKAHQNNPGYYTGGRIPPLIST